VIGAARFLPDPFFANEPGPALFSLCGLPFPLFFHHRTIGSAAVGLIGPGVSFLQTDVAHVVSLAWLIPSRSSWLLGIVPQLPPPDFNHVRVGVEDQHFSRKSSVSSVIRDRDLVARQRPPSRQTRREQGVSPPHTP